MATASSNFKTRLCYTLVSDLLKEMEYELVEVKSIRILADYPWMPGKRLRPITFLLAFLSVQVEIAGHSRLGRREARLAAAIELLHEASLIHDDIVDRSTVRRGKPSMHTLNGDGLALLVGDYMVFRGLKLILDAAETRQDIKFAQQLANTGLEIAHGEVDQLDSYLNRRKSENRMSMKNYLNIIAKKTAGFFAGCAMGGAALAGANSDLQLVYRKFGRNMGLVFQMVDDLMDILGDPEKAKKSLKNNLAEGTITLPIIHAFRLYPDHPVLQQLSNGDEMTPQEQDSLNHLLADQSVLQSCKETMGLYAQKAKTELGKMPSNIFRMGLTDLFEYIRQCPWGGLETKLL